MKILIPPSEGKNPQSDGPLFSMTHFMHTKEVEAIISQLQSYKGDYAELFDIKKERVEKVKSDHIHLFQQPTTKAIDRYSGVVYKNIEYASLNNKSFFDDHVRIVSGLFGLLCPLTLIPNYRLKMSKLSLFEFWKPIITRELAEEDIIIDCLTELHRKAYDHPNKIVVDFFIEKNGQLKNAGHHAKAVKGKFIRWLCENKIRDTKRFSQFREEGYQWDGRVFVQ